MSPSAAACPTACDSSRSWGEGRTPKLRSRKAALASLSAKQPPAGITWGRVYPRGQGAPGSRDRGAPHSVLHCDSVSLCSRGTAILSLASYLSRRPVLLLALCPCNAWHDSTLGLADRYQMQAWPLCLCPPEGSSCTGCGAQAELQLPVTLAGIDLTHKLVLDTRDLLH